MDSIKLELHGAPKRAEPTYPLLAFARHRLGLDGRGVTTLIAGVGCPLSCAYCINRELLKREPESVTAAELIERVRVDDLYFRATGGGLTFGGGEALLHTDFYEALRPLCPNWRLTAETSLNVPRESVYRAVSVFEAFIVDIKTLDPEIYLAYTGRGIGETAKNLEYLIGQVSSDNLKVRVPLIPTFNDTEDIEKTCAALEKMGVGDIEVFEYAVREPTERQGGE